jgi:pyruvate kinase
MRKTKIICTLGPASGSPEIVEKLMDAGMNVVRFNFSHGTHESHKKMYDVVKKLREKKKMPIATLMDTKGPEVRLGDFENNHAILEEGQEFTLTTEKIVGNANIASVSFTGLPNDVKPGTTLLLDDGLIELEVVKVDGPEIHCKVINGGPISNRKGLNVPGVSLSQAYLSDVDRDDILFAIETGFDFIAASFVRNAQDVFEIRQILSEKKSDDIRIISKIENAEGVKNIDEILRASDGIMVARGDLGVEIPFEELPSLQKMLIHKAYNEGKIVITATQMLESMTKNPRPTRAESTDVANAIYDGTSAVMLSGETASGLYPVKAVETMARIAIRTERDINYRKRFENQEYTSEKNNITTAISHATCMTAFDLGAAAIIVVTLSGHSARRISKFRPDIPIVGCTVSEKSWRQMSMSWGVVPIMIREENDLDQLCSHAVESAMKAGVLDNGDIVVITAGVPLGMSGSTNLLKVQIAGHVLLRGHGLGNLTACGNLCSAHSEEEALQNFREGDILVIHKTSNNLLGILKHAKAIIAEEDGVNSHAAIAGLALGIPVIVGAEVATNLLKSGTIVTVDAEHGTVSNTESIKAHR